MFGIKRRFQRCKVWPPRFKESSVQMHHIWVSPSKRAVSATIVQSSTRMVADRHGLAAHHNKHCWRAFQRYQHRWPWTTLNRKIGVFSDYFSRFVAATHISTVVAVHSWNVCGSLKSRKKFTRETRDSRLSYGESPESVSHLALNRYRVVTDRQTDRIAIANTRPQQYLPIQLSRVIKTDRKCKILAPLGGFEPPTFRLTAERANRLRHKGCVTMKTKFL